MEEKTELHQWQNIEIFGTQVLDYAAHIEVFFFPVALLHFAALIICASTLFVLLSRFLESPLACKNSQSFKRLFTFVLTPSFVLCCLSGCYLYFMSSVIYGAGYSAGLVLIFYAAFVLVYFLSCFHISGNFEKSVGSKKKIYIFKIIVVVSASAIFVLSFGEYYG